MIGKGKIVNYLLLALNIAIIAATELVGGGTFFFETGLIHGIALVFIIAVVLSIFRQYYLADPILKKFFNACLIAFAVFSISHVVEFLSHYLFGMYGDYLFALVINFYAISLLIMIAGSEIFLRAYAQYRRSQFPFALTSIAIVAFAGFSALIVFRNSLISLETDSVAPYLYSAVVLAVAFVFVKRVIRLKHAVPLLARFFNLLASMAVCVAISAIIYALYEIIKDAFTLPEHQVVYLSHFAFYGGMSLLFVAFRNLSSIGGGVIDDIKSRQSANFNGAK